MASNDNNAGNWANTPNSSRRQFSPPRSTSPLAHIPSLPPRTDAQLRISQLPYAEWVEALGLPRISSPPPSLPLNNTDREVNEQHEDAVFSNAVRLGQLRVKPNYFATFASNITDTEFDSDLDFGDTWHQAKPQP